MANIDDLSDEQLVEIVRSKDQEMYAGLVTRYQNKLIRYASTLINNPDEALDVVQDSFIKAFKNLNGFNPKYKFSPWIYRIVHNEAINYIKKHRRSVSLDDNPWVERVAHYKEKHDEVFDQQQLKKLLHKHINDLPYAYREPLVLFYLEEKSYEEISDILHMPVSSIGTRIFRARKLLQQTLKEEGGRL